MEVTNVNHQLKDLLNKATKVLILIGGEPRSDLVAAGLALNNLFNSFGKVSHLVSAKKLPDDISVISGVENIKRDLESRNLVISLNYEKNPIEKISYKMEGKTFNLIVKPKRDINLDEVQTSFAGGDYNLIFVLGTRNLNDLHIYNSHRDLFESLPLVNLDIDESNTRFGKLNIINTEIGSISGFLSLVLNESGIKLPDKSANLLMMGMRDATQNFTDIKGPAIFEAAAYASKTKEGVDETKKFFFSKSGKENKDLPKDWLSPKVYHSSKVS